MREHSLVELTEHDDSAADIISHNIHICTAAFIVHNVYRYNKWTPPRNSGGIPSACLAWSVRVMYLLALVRTYTGTSCADGQHGHCTFLPVSLMCLRVRARVYIRVRVCILVQCFVMGNPSHVCVLVFGLSRCNCIATPIDMDSLLVMSLYLCWLFVLNL